MNNIFKKRGQLTIYIILGIFILAIVSIAIMFMHKQQDRTENIALKDDPVKNYVDYCLKDVLKDALDVVGAKGGYYNIPDHIRLDPLAYLGIGKVPLMPYWYYENKNNVPTLDDIGLGVSDYVSENLYRCINERAFKALQIIKKGKPVVKTSFQKKYVSVDVDYPLEIKTKDTVIDLEKFSAKVNVDFLDIYDYAKQVMDYENAHAFMENITIDIMAMNPDIPFTDVSFECDDLVWYIDEIEQALKDALLSETRKIRFEDVDHMPFLASDKVYKKISEYTLKDWYDGNKPPKDVPADAYSYFHYYIDASNNSYPLKAQVIFDPQFSFDMQARPSKNGVLRSDMMKGYRKYLSYLCINFYHFTYDVTYPVVISIMDPEAYNGKGYVFKFAFLVNVRNNAPNREKSSYNIFDHISPYVDYCNNATGRLVDIRAKGYSEGYDNMELKDVNITFDCFKYYCELGSTHADDGVYRLQTRLPANCQNGYIVAKKSGYLEQKIQDNGDELLEIPMQKLKRLKIDVKKHRQNNLNTAKPLDDWEVAAIMISSGDYSTIASFKKSSDATVELIYADNTYEFEVMVIDESDNIISGGYMANVSITTSDLDADTMIINTVELIPKPLLSSAQYKALQYLRENATYKAALHPEFVND